MIRFAENLNKMIAAGLGGALEAPRTEVAVGHCIRYLEASGPVASFESNIAAPIRNLRVTMEPIQDLHGQANPYPAGGGKNLLNPALFVEQAGWYIIELTLTPNTAYTMSSNMAFAKADELPVYFKTDNIGGGNATILVYTGHPVTQTSDENGHLYISERRVSGTDVFSNYQWQIELGSTATAFAPYSNICPISGRQSVTVWREASYDPSADPALTIQLGTTVYGGTLDVSTGKLTVTHGEIASYNGEVLTGEWMSDRDVYAAGTTPTIGAQVVYVLDTPQTIDLDPQQITTLIGDNNVWSDAGDVDVTYIYYEETEGY